MEVMTRSAIHNVFGVLLLVLFATLAGCRQAPSTREQAVLKHYPVQGRIVSTNQAHVVLDHEAVPGFMDAMTMSYKLRDPAIITELHPGDRITATILVRQGARGTLAEPELDEIVVISQARPDYKPKVQFHVPQTGERVPDFVLLNQSGKTIHLAQFHGKVLLATFIYTRCTLPTFCPRMSRNFATIDQALSADPRLRDATHLLSISFDPVYDTPQVLRTYGGSYTGRYNNETFTHWDFAAPPVPELSSITQFFGVGITPGESSSLNHSLSTVLIGRDGRILAWYPTNEWEPADVIGKVKAQLGAAA